jgi:DnaJ family protein C protein 7
MFTYLFIVRLFCFVLLLLCLFLLFCFVIAGFDCIELAPTESSYWANRAAALMKLKKFSEALKDALKATDLQPGYVVCIVRASRCSMQLGDFRNARLILEPVLSTSNLARKEMENVNAMESHFGRIQVFIDQSNFTEAKDMVMKSMQDCEAPQLRLLLVECLIGLKYFDQARLMCESLYAADPNNLHLLRLRGTVFYYTGSIALAVKHFQQILKSDPDNVKVGKLFRLVKKLESTKAAGNEAFARGQNQEAIKIYSDALALDEKNDNYNCTLYGNRAAAKVKLQLWEEAKLDCDLALLTNSSYTKVILRRAQCLIEMECFQEAIRDYEAAQKLSEGDEAKVLKSSNLRNLFFLLMLNAIGYCSEAKACRSPTQAEQAKELL